VPKNASTRNKGMIIKPSSAKQSVALDTSTSRQPNVNPTKQRVLDNTTIALTHTVASLRKAATSATRNPARIQKLFTDHPQNYSAASSPDDVIHNTTASME
jgi:hypothetical protein